MLLGDRAQHQQVLANLRVHARVDQPHAGGLADDPDLHEGVQRRDVHAGDPPQVEQDQAVAAAAHVVVADGVEHRVGRAEKQEAAQAVDQRLGAVAIQQLVVRPRTFHRTAERGQRKVAEHRADHAVAQHEQQQGEQDADQDAGHEADEDHRAENDQHDREVDRLKAAHVLVQPLDEQLPGEQEHSRADQQLGHPGHQVAAEKGQHQADGGGHQRHPATRRAELAVDRRGGDVGRTRRAGDQRAQDVALAHVGDLARGVDVLAVAGHQRRQRHRLRQKGEEGDGHDLRRDREDEVGVDGAEGRIRQQRQRPGFVRDVEQPAARDQVLVPEALDGGDDVEHRDQHQGRQRQRPGPAQARRRDQQEDRRGDVEQQLGPAGRILQRLAHLEVRRVDRDADARHQQQPADARHEAADDRVRHQFEQAREAEAADQPEEDGHGERGQGHHREHRREPARADHLVAEMRHQQARNRGQDDHRLLVQAHHVQALARGQRDVNAQQRPAAQQDADQQRQERRHRAGEDDAGEGVAPKRVVEPVEQAERDVGCHGLGAVSAGGQFRHGARMLGHSGAVCVEVVQKRPDHDFRDYFQSP